MVVLTGLSPPLLGRAASANPLKEAIPSGTKLRSRSQIHMDILKDFKFFAVQMPQQPTTRLLEPMTYDTDGILRSNLSCLISPSQVVGIDHVSTFGLDHEWFCSIREYKVLRLCIQCPFISYNRQFFPLPSKECDCEGLEYCLL